MPRLDINVPFETDQAVIAVGRGGFRGQGVGEPAFLREADANYCQRAVHDGHQISIIAFR